MKYNLKTMATTTTFFKRFYLKHSIMDYQPKYITTACLFIAAKSCNVHFGHIDEFTKLIKNISSDILEFFVFNELNFHLLVHHPYQPIYGIYLEVQKFMNVKTDILKQVYSKACKIANRSLTTDVEFLFSPAQIAIACWYSEYLMDMGDFNRLEGIMAEIRNEIQSSYMPPKERIMEISEKLKKCANKEHDPTSDLYKGYWHGYKSHKDLPKQSDHTVFEN
ncbi:cyclin-like protein [Rozella allomycis CSF55]|uniref:Cyclin-like protein n=1 Tax=Rozella allomycis (strain CSF55) TaxID=988480 RepID=A0A075AZ63_ROZAC|nr:CyclinH/Ccl1 domain-containing protein [Rozella allomycis CSF55]RKP17225.1 cyclin-like protein [Rozella allomycis CSF55]|eukprot:EPZ34002.1 CyclinH/Ccl1 domain-containing protein [Rozella allomycis CSF55]